tara:strand:- start:1503 stop:2663 length:1161 start_codon:yes stop_codon:yes gene_type:complete
MRVCFITSSRADFGTLKHLLNEIINIKRINPQLLITGSHTSKIFGSNSEIKVFKTFKLKKIKIKSQNPNTYSVLDSFSEATKKIGKAFKSLKPDVVVVFGDRYEMLASSLAAFILRINIVHLAGGEKTIGSLDDSFRHSITKFSNLHFPVAKVYKKRIIQLGEDPRTIFNYGSLNLEKIKKNHYLNKEKLQKLINIKLSKKNILVTYHPDTVDDNKSLKNLKILLKSLKRFKNINFLITSPNADSQGVVYIKHIKRFIKKNKLSNFSFHKSLGSQIYLSLLKYVDGVVGNSSSGISEVPFFKIGTVNIGDRQKGRINVPSIINCPINERKIVQSIKKLFSNKFNRKIKKDLSFYGKGNASKNIAKKIGNFNYKKFKKKIFYDINFS